MIKSNKSFPLVASSLPSTPDISTQMLTKLLCWVYILSLVSVDVDQDDLGCAVGQARVQTGHCHEHKKGGNLRVEFPDPSRTHAKRHTGWCTMIPGVTPTTSPLNPVSSLSSLSAVISALSPSSIKPGSRIKDVFQRSEMTQTRILHP